MPIDRVYWDSMVFVHALEKRHPKIAVMEDLILRATQGDLLIVTSVFTTAEVAKVSNPPLAEEQEELIERFFNNEWIRLMPVTRQTCKLARHILRNFPGIKGKDAIHLATASETPGVEVMHSYETRLINKTGRLPNVELAIEEPRWPLLIDRANP